MESTNHICLLANLVGKAVARSRDKRGRKLPEKKQKQGAASRYASWLHPLFSAHLANNTKWYRLGNPVQLREQGLGPRGLQTV